MIISLVAIEAFSMKNKKFDSFFQIKEMMEMNRRFYSLQTLYQSIQAKTNSLDDSIYSLKTKWRKQDYHLKKAQKELIPKQVHKRGI